jgi:hypothetical protein
MVCFTLQRASAIYDASTHREPRAQLTRVDMQIKLPAQTLTFDSYEFADFRSVRHMDCGSAGARDPRNQARRHVAKYHNSET